MNLFQQSIIQRLHLIQVINPCIQCVADIAGDFLSFTLSIKQCLADLQSPIAQLIPFPQHQLTHLNVPKCNFCNRLALRPLILKITESFSEEDLEFFVTQNLSANFAPHETSDIVWKLKQLLRTYQLSKNQTPDLVNMGVQTQNIDPINYKKQFFQIGRILNIHRLCPEDILEAVKKQVQTIQHYEKSQFQTQIAELRKQNTDLMHENVLMKRENSKLLEYQKYGLKSRPQSHIVSPPTQPNHAETHKILRQYSLNPTNDISDRRQKFTECMTAKRQVTTTKTQIYTLEQEVERLKSKNLVLSYRAGIADQTDFQLSASNSISNDFPVFITAENHSLTQDQISVIFLTKQLAQVSNGKQVINKLPQEYINHYIQQFNNLVQELTINAFQQLQEHFLSLKRYILIERQARFFRQKPSLMLAQLAFKDAYSEHQELYLYDQLKNYKVLNCVNQLKTISCILLSGAKASVGVNFNVVLAILISQNYGVQKRNGEICLFEE
ncbi:hypothetical protein SS50377_26440 [Spironucleus salmonicida]|uniref:Uncharacterized protein n=1 Tax=Spironucleus salmonicida TaxID=348837 RepID=V6LA57_9EUKA|nr:hypothetical protein SS50377_26440 [Spironucleus salmonicida]|eukprot:EST41300.1 Hypothetical protein SS50377_19013 [Spironucleus salmonicida]